MPPRSPTGPSEMDWSAHFPEHFQSSIANEHSGANGMKSHSSKRVEFADIGCGFGGLLMALAPMFPDILMLG